MRTPWQTVGRNLAACFALACLFHWPDLSFETFRRSVVLQVLHTFCVWIGMAAFLVRAWRMNTPSDAHTAAGKVARWASRILMSVDALWHFLFIGWFIGHRMRSPIP
jgi:hypothetical protein